MKIYKAFLPLDIPFKHGQKFLKNADDPSVGQTVFPFVFAERKELETGILAIMVGAFDATRCRHEIVHEVFSDHEPCIMFKGAARETCIFPTISQNPNDLRQAEMRTLRLWIDELKCQHIGVSFQSHFPGRMHVISAPYQWHVVTAVAPVTMEEARAIHGYHEVMKKLG